MAINPHLAHLREVYSQVPEAPKPPKQWAIVALLVSSAALALFGNVVFSLIGMIAFGFAVFFSLAVTKGAVIDRYDYTAASQMLATPGFFDFAMQRDQRWLANVEQMRMGFNHFMIEARPGDVPPPVVRPQAAV
jgi:hypothetical protein